MFTELSTSRAPGYYGYSYEPQSPPLKRKAMTGPFALLHSRHKQVVVGLVVAVMLLGGFLYVRPFPTLLDGGASVHSRGVKDNPLDACLRYPLQQSYHKYNPSSTHYSITIVADMDTASKTGQGKWKSVLKSGTLIRNSETGKYSMTWDAAEKVITSSWNDGSRGMELSELTYFNNQLLTFDDRTGIVFFVEGDQVIPKHILMDGSGHVSKGLKVEWSTVKDSHLYVGSTGKEWTTPTGEFVNNNPQWIARIDSEGRIERLDWGQLYTALREATDTKFPGYLLHEGIRWNAALRRWFFLPRRVSKESYDDELDQSRGSNTVISMNEQFSDIRISQIGEHNPTHGFSSFQFVPFREHEVVAIKTEEYRDTVATYIMVFDLEGKVLMEEVLIGNQKYEGIEFV